MSQSVSLCPACRGSTQVALTGLYDDRYGYPGLFALHACSACGHFHIAAQFTPEAVGELYTNYYPRRNFDVETFQPEQDRGGFLAWLNGDRASAFRWVPRKVRVLDIGCGLGCGIAYHRDRGCEAVGIEADLNVQPVAKRYGLDIHPGVFDGSQFEPGSFDYVTVEQVAEHVADPHALFAGIARILKPGGHAIITTPNPRSLGARIYGRRWLHWHVPYHLQFYTSHSLGLVARESGLTVSTSITLTASDWQYYQWRHAVEFPRPGEKSSFWSFMQPPRTLLFRLIGLAYRLRLHRWISRALDGLGLGDNHVFVLRKP
jgi:SAM-dependent methyltransferase